MTEQEANVLGARLRQIWVAKSCPSVATCTLDDQGFRFRCEVAPGVVLTVLGVVIERGTGVAIAQVLCSS